ncbi:MAG: N-(5'-phosphoribosyl)anthranilate isomerase [Alphaproteobacteria bacterium CG1_02_46_17]|nr:MAG: N-(5'-phosphoribosyl)anthranilate isomerase [Alphaproteobacteria bacterium CG1_02_46_17]
MTDVKICGIKEKNHLDVAAQAGARFIGLVFYPKSPRFIDPEMARLLSRSAPTGVRMVGLFVDPDDAWLSHVLGAVPLDMIQLHGAESPVRVQEIRSIHHLPIIKAIPVARPEDLEKAQEYEQVADWLLFDSKSQKSSVSGGSGISFDWKILEGKRFERPWMLSGGLHVGNVQNALSCLHPNAVDVSSGVESELGIKDPSRIIEFLKQVRQH